MLIAVVGPRFRRVLVLALGLLVASPGLAREAGPGPDGVRPAPEYVKREGKRWLKVTRDEFGVAVLGEADAPRTPPTPGVRSKAATSSGPSFAAAEAASGMAPLSFRPAVSYPVGAWPEALAIADLNHDGLADVALLTNRYADAANDRALHVFHQDRQGQLQRGARYPLDGSPASIHTGDVNGDGWADVVIANGAVIGVFLQNALGALDPMVSYPTRNSYMVRVGDVNGDGRDDVVGIAIGGYGDDVGVFLQDAGGTLAPERTYHVARGGFDEVEIGDVNGDGRNDVVVASGQGFGDNFGILPQQADRTLGLPVYHDMGGNELTWGLAVADLDGDRRQDVVVSNGKNRPQSRLGLFLQNAEGVLGAALSLESYDVAQTLEAADLNGDGLKDLVVLHGGWQAAGVYLQTTGALGPEQLYPIPYASHYNRQGLALGDLNGDGLRDVAIADYNHGLVILLQVPRIRLVTPAARSVITRGSFEHIRWQHNLGLGARFRIELSRDGGATWRVLNGSAPASGEDTGSALWIVSGPGTTAARIRITSEGHRAESGNFTIR